MQHLLPLTAVGALAPVLGLRLAPVLRGPIRYLCPSCGGSLLPSGTMLRCASGHAIDCAKEGHHYLLKRPPPPAVVKESDEIARAGRAFHDAGGYAKQADAVAAEVVRALGPRPADGAGAPRQLLAAGCADGFYLRAVERALQARSKKGGDGNVGDGSAPASVGLWGIDSGKLAVRYAAKRQPSARFAVAPGHALPFADGVFDLVFSAFAPSSWDEYCRVLRPGGAVVVARAGPRHLKELRALSGAPTFSEPKQFAAGQGELYCRFASEERYRGEVLLHLLETTPFCRRASPERQAAMRRYAEDEEGLLLTVDIISTTHRVWLGTGGFAEKPDNLY